MAYFQDLLRRRVPQVLVIYLGSSWGLVQFVDFIAQRYALSPYLTDLALLLPLLMLPSVLLVTYFHGAPGADEWVMAEKVGIPVNLVVAAVAVALFVRGKDLGAATTMVTVTDEEGVATERVIPKSEFRKRLNVYYFDAPAEDTAAAWLQYGLPNAIVADLSQDHFLDVYFPPLFADRLRESGFMDLTGVPLALQREIAEEKHRNQFLNGRVSVVDGQIEATVGLYDVARGRLIEERSYMGSSVLDLADQIAGQLRVDLDIPDLGDESTVQDLPVSQVLTDNVQAYRAFVEGVRRAQVDRDFAGAGEAFAEAVAQDPTFASAQYGLAQIYYLTNRTPEAAAPLQAAMDHLYRIPERGRFQIKSDYYFIVRQDVDKALASIEMWADLFPDDIQAFQARAQIQRVRDDRSGMLASLERILELDPNQWDVLLQIGNLHEGMGNLEQARQAFQTYADEFPEDHAVLTQLAGVSRRQGDLDQAGDYYDRALLLAPSNVGVMVGMAGILRAQGDFEAATRQLEQAESSAGTPEEQAQVHAGWASYHEMRGQMDQALTRTLQRAAAVEAAQPGLVGMQVRIFLLPEAYVRAGREQEAYALVRQVEGQIPPPFNMLAAMGTMGLQLAREDADGIEAAIPGVEAIIQQLRYEFLRPSVIFAQGRMHELRGEYRQAMSLYEEERRLNPGDASVPAQLGRCQRELGQHEQAVALFQESLKGSPWSPTTNYDLALTYEAMGRSDDARAHLQRALDAWADADAGYAPAERARAAMERLSG